jgi:hypothetical protein
MGNFVFDLDDVDRYYLGSAAYQTAVFHIELSPGAVPVVQARPVTLDWQENRPRPATKSEAGAIQAWLSAVHAALSAQ